MPLLSLVVAEDGTLKCMPPSGCMFTTPIKGEDKLGKGRMKNVNIDVERMHSYFRKFNP